MRALLVASLLLPAVAAAQPAPTPTPATVAGSGELTLPVTDRGRESAMQRAIDQASCTGEYADAILALAPRAREFERAPEANYSFCLRNSATYECLYYGAEGRMKKRTVSVSAHGTAFSYKEKNGEYYLLTNEHVASWPAVTDEDHEVDGVPVGCKKIDEQLKLVRDQADDYEPGHIALTKVALDAQLDAAIVKTRTKLPLMPYRIGRSALLKAGNVVSVRGFPLGMLQATNFGKVVSAYDHDHDKAWDHVDFVTDALLAKGNSGSPVMAVSCRTGELELVGLFHAGYRGSPALNVVVGIDQLREFMAPFKSPSRASAADEHKATPEDRAALLSALSRPDFVPYFRLGDRFARARVELDGAILYDVFQDSFPARDLIQVTLKDVPAEGTAGQLGAFALDAGDGRPRWLKVEAADAETQDLARKLLDLARVQLLRTVAYREAAPTAKSSRDAFRKANDLLKQLDRRKVEGNDLLHALADVADRLPPNTPEAVAAAATQVAADAAAAPPVTPTVPQQPAASAPNPPPAGPGQPLNPPAQAVPQAATGSAAKKN